MINKQIFKYYKRYMQQYKKYLQLCMLQQN